MALDMEPCIDDETDVDSESLSPYGKENKIESN